SSQTIPFRVTGRLTKFVCAPPAQTRGGRFKLFVRPGEMPLGFARQFAGSLPKAASETRSNDCPPPAGPEGHGCLAPYHTSSTTTHRVSPPPSKGLKSSNLPPSSESSRRS